MRRVADAPPVAVRRRPVRCGVVRPGQSDGPGRSGSERPGPASPASSPGRGGRAVPRPGTRPAPRRMSAACPRGRTRRARRRAASRHRGVVRQRLDPQPPQAAHAETAVAQRRDHVGDELKPQPPTGGDRRGAFRSSAHRLRARAGAAAWGCRRDRVPARATQAGPGRGRGRRRSGWPGPGFWGRGGCGRRRARR
jgi:hypothetical protein